MQVNPTQSQLEAGLSNWIQEKREEERRIGAVALAHCIQYAMFSQRIHPDISEDRFFNYFSTGSYDTIIKTAAERYQLNGESPTPEMLRLYDRLRKWQKENGKD